MKFKFKKLLGCFKLTGCFGISKKYDVNYYYKNCSELAQEHKEKKSGIYNRSSKEECKRHSELVSKILNREITLSVLKNISQLKKGEKQKFLEDIKDTVPLDILHELNEKVIEHALDLVDSKDPTFALRTPQKDEIFRDLLYLEAKKNNFNVEINEKGTLVINLPKNILKLCELLIYKFYLPKFRDDEFKKNIYSTYETFFEELDDNTEDEQENCYLKQGLARSIMTILVSKDIIYSGDQEKEENKMENHQKEQMKITFLHKLNDVNGNYIKNLANSNILELVAYSKFSNNVETIEILGDI